METAEHNGAAPYPEPEENRVAQGTHANEAHAPCPLEELLNVVGGKWKCIILRHVLIRPHRFSELRARMTGVTQKILTQQLRDLERAGFLGREIFPEIPPRVVYSATPLTVGFKPILIAMHNWSANSLIKIKMPND